MQNHYHIGEKEENSIYKKIHTMLKNNVNPLDKYKDFIYNIHNMDPIIHNKWSDELCDFPLWQQIMKDLMKERDTEHIKKVINGYNHTFIDFDGHNVTFICECGKTIIEPTCAQIIPIDEIGCKVYQFMLCHCQ